MYYDNTANILDLAEKSDFSIFVDREDAEFCHNFSVNLNPSRFTIIEPGKNHTINIDQIREIISSSHTIRKKDTFYVIKNADKMNEQAQNAFLKLLEEPPENYHFVMQVKNAYSLLETVLSRGDIYIKRENSPLDAPVSADEQIKSYAKQLISANESGLVSLMNRITSEKDYKKDPRGFTVSIVECAVEITYKSYFKTKNLNFLKKLPKLLNLLDNLKQNGNIKLHLIADLC